MCLNTAKSRLANSKNLHTTQRLKTINQKFLTSLNNKQTSTYDTTGFVKFQSLQILDNLLVAFLNQKINEDSEPWRLVRNRTNKKTKVRNYTKIKETKRRYNFGRRLVLDKRNFFEGAMIFIFRF